MWYGVGGGGAGVGEVARSVTWCLCDCVHVCAGVAAGKDKESYVVLSACLWLDVVVSVVCVCVTPVFV